MPQDSHSSPPVIANQIAAADRTADALAVTVWRTRTLLESWVEENGWAGFDPYDIRGTSWYLDLARRQLLVSRAARKVLFTLIDRFPLTARKLAHVEAINPKGMGLFVAAFCRLFEATDDQAYLERARECADWLLSHPSRGYPGTSWGYPFDWQSVVFIPKGTPSAVVSSVIGDGLWRLAHLTGEAKYMDACVGVCDFILQGLNRTEINGQALCFSYTPVDRFLVHNANLFAAEFLSRVGQQTGLPEWSELAVRAGNYFLLEQREDGSVFYWGQAQNQNAPNHRDCYHSGFEIRSLWGLWRATGDLRFREAAMKYFEFFEESYIGNDGAVMNLPGVVFPVDIHACAEALLCSAVMSEAFPERSLKIISDTLPWILDLMQNEDGSFAYMAFESGRIDRTPYLRWGQAWMLRALSELQVVLKDECGPNFQTKLRMEGAG